jgi:hypothetical protein
MYISKYIKLNYPVVGSVSLNKIFISTTYYYGKMRLVGVEKCIQKLSVKTCCSHLGKLNEASRIILK